MTEENARNDLYSKHLEDVASTLPAEWRESFCRFVATGDAEKPFLDFLGSSKAGQAAVETIFNEQAAAFEGLAAILRSSKTDTLKVGDVMKDGSIFAGLTANGKQQIYAMPTDLSVTLTFNGAVKSVKKLNADKALGHDDWQIPSLEDLRVLQKNQNEGDLKDTFNTSGNKGSGTGYPGLYLSSTEDRGSSSYVPYVQGVRFSDGLESLNYKDRSRLSCRPVRLVEVPRS